MQDAAASTRPIDPPPAPRLTMSRLLQRDAMAADAARRDSGGPPPTIRQMSVLVPPMSNGIRLSLSSSCAA